MTAHLDTKRATSAPFFTRTVHTREHLHIHAAKNREQIKLEEGVPLPDDQPQKKRKAASDAWDLFWDDVKPGHSFVVTDSFMQTVKGSANKRGIIVKTKSVGPFKTRIWRVA